MKLKSLLAAGAMSLVFAGLANAAVNHVYITGSTAFRNSIFSTLDAAGQVFDATPTFTGYGNSTAAKCSYMIFSNNISGTPYIIKCEWSGSEAGILDCVSNTLETFPADSLLGAPGTSTANATPTTPPTVDSHATDLGFADNNQAFSRTTKPSLTGSEVGVIPFTWVKNAQLPAQQTTDWQNWTNLTLEQLFVAIGNGGTPLSMFTGNQADTNFVYVAGRNNNSGTRANALLILGYPLATPVTQIYITGGANDGSAAITWIVPNPDNEGQDSGGTLATTMTYCGSATQQDANDPWVNAGLGGTGDDFGWYAVAYLGRSDATSALTGHANNAVEMLFNGVASTSSNIETGVYPFWGNEWLYQSLNMGTGGSTVYGKLVAKIPVSLDGTTGIPYSSMHVYKTSSASYPIEIGF